MRCVPSSALAATLTQGNLEVNAIAATQGSPTEDKGVACAVEGQAGYGVAGDDPLLKLERYSHIVILPRGSFWLCLRKSKRAAHSAPPSPANTT